MISIHELEAIIFDFDGVFTDNFVDVNERGEESVRCSRADGLGIQAIRKIAPDLKLMILSTEQNPVVSKRADKLGLFCIQGSSDKVQSLQKVASEQQFHLEKTLYIGNDLNDYHVMKLCRYSACPADSHHDILQIAKIHLQTKGGHGIVRELVENIFKIDIKALF